MRFTMDVDLEADPSTPKGDRMMMLQEMIEMIEMGLVEDFGRGAWGGYEGPFIEAVRIRQEEEESNGL